MLKIGTVFVNSLTISSHIIMNRFRYTPHFVCLAIYILWFLPSIAKASTAFLPTAIGSVYIERYKDKAIAEMHRTGVPASIKLAQAMFESNYGRSRLALEGNNHFGIKCRPEWDGDKIFLDDDAPKECFRKYFSVEDSYTDHSDILRGRKWYASLFLLPITDYVSWAKGLKKAGYASLPEYDRHIIQLIETYQLAHYDQELPPALPIYAQQLPSRNPQTQPITTVATNNIATIDKALRRTLPAELYPQNRQSADMPSIHIAMQKLPVQYQHDDIWNEPHDEPPTTPTENWVAAAPVISETPSTSGYWQPTFVTDDYAHNIPAQPIPSLTQATTPNTDLPPTSGFSYERAIISSFLPTSTEKSSLNTYLPTTKPLPTAPPPTLAVTTPPTKATATAAPIPAPVAKVATAAPTTATPTKVVLPRGTAVRAGNVLPKQAEKYINKVKVVRYNFDVTAAQIATTYRLTLADVLVYNDIEDANMVFEANTPIYLEIKKDKSKTTRHTVNTNESLWQIAQQYGLTLSALCKRNNISPKAQPEVGEQLLLRGKAVKLSMFKK